MNLENKADLVSWHRRGWLWKQATLLFEILPLPPPSSLIDLPEILFSHLQKMGKSMYTLQSVRFEMTSSKASRQYLSHGKYL